MLVGEKVILRAIERSDIPRFVKWFNDPEVIRFLAMHVPLSVAAEEKWFERQLEDKDTRVLAIETKDGVHIGNLGLHNFNYRDSHAELGIAIGEKEYWGQGYGTDAIRTVLKWAFGELNLNRVFLRTYPFNPRAIRCYEKCGFVIEGRLRQAIYRDGQYHDEIVMGVLRDEFLGAGR
ncbi:MAG: GNAT family N-acetyltransferase [Chloroflexi bacterium]|nr:GNAT family N-acetyltransferase [Chloroflexota bacterium]